MNFRLFDLVQGVTGGDQHLFWRAASIGTGAAEVALFDQGDLQPSLTRRHGDAEPGISAAQNQDIIGFARHSLGYPRLATYSNADRLSS
jgi:hypothetical protein